MNCDFSVHPRVCGEQGGSTTAMPAKVGSSPRVRGTVYTRIYDPVDYRFIPACAGNRQRWFRRPVVSAVHPRVCGEQSAFACELIALYGSSPRVRGTESRIVELKINDRFIPACAGNS